MPTGVFPGAWHRRPGWHCSQAPFSWRQSGQHSVQQPSQHEQLSLLRGQGTNSFRTQFTAGWAGAVCRQATKQWLALAIAAMS
jgi:hypothetical protein